MGVGDPASTPVPAALANAVFDATAVRLRTVPFRPDRVKAALEGRQAEPAGRCGPLSHASGPGRAARFLTSAQSSGYPGDVIGFFSHDAPGQRSDRSGARAEEGR